MPVLERLEGVPVSIDTAKSEVARRALELGAELVNDVTALRGDPELAGVVADAGAYLCLMHMQGEPRTMQVDPRYDDVVVRGRGVPRGAARVRGRGRDPGGARLPRPGHRLRQDGRAELRARAAARRAASRSAARCWSASRARARSAGCSATRRRRPGSLAASLGAAVAAYERGASIFRVHDVREHVEALAAAGAIADDDRAARPRAASATTACSTSERSDGQTFLFDVELEVGEPARGRASRTRSTTATSPRCVREVSDGARVPPARGARGRGRRRARRALPGRARPRARAQARASSSTARSTSRPSRAERP